MKQVHLSTVTSCAAPQDVCDLFQTVFGHPMSPASWHWKYQQAPARQRCHILAHSSTGQLVGHAGMVVFPGVWRQREIGMAQVTDVMVHPEYRHDLGPDNLYRRLMRALQQALLNTLTPDTTVIYGFPGQRPATLGARMGFYRLLPRIEQLTLSVPPLPVGWARWRDAWHLHLTRQTDPAADWLDHWSQVAARHRHTPQVVKNANYLRWRYFSHPDHPYQFWSLRRHRWQNAGWLVTRRQPVPTVVDACLAPDLLDGQWPHWMSALARATGVAEWTAWQPAQPGSTNLSPIYPVEMAGATGFHPDHPSPRFQPGDTDVY